MEHPLILVQFLRILKRYIFTKVSQIVGLLIKYNYSLHNYILWKLECVEKINKPLLTILVTSVWFF